MNLITKVLRADSNRVSRLHDLKGRFVGLSALLYMPRYLINWGLGKAKRYRRLPWIPENATQKIAAVIDPKWTVLECGAGMSTLWWARRVSRVIALEHNASWYAMLAGVLAREQLKRVELHLTPDYPSLIVLHAATADFFVVDGLQRDLCLHMILEHARRPVWIYLDNTDRSPFREEMRRAEEALLNIRLNCSFFEYYTGYAPGQLTPSEGLLVCVSS